MSDPLILVRGLVKDYHDGERTLHVLKGVDFSLATGEVVAIVGPSGSGKSTLLNLLSALDRPTSGTILLGGENLSTMSDSDLNLVRRDKIGLVFQFHHLIPELHAWENVAMPLLLSRCSRAEARRQASEMLERVGLGDRLNHIPGKLSGGEQQRVALARALMKDPVVVLADEPTGNLDPDTGKDVIELLWQLTKKRGRALVIVTHEPAIAKKADRILRLAEGHLSPVLS